MTVLKETTLANGLKISFVDESNRYFGDYHRICVVATIRCSLDTLRGTIDEELHRRALSQYGDALVVEKRFERMGVASDDVAAVRDALIDDFMRHATQYLARPEYPGRLLSAELNRRQTRRLYV